MAELLLGSIFLLGLLTITFYAILYFMQDKMLFYRRPLQINIKQWIDQNHPNSEVKIVAKDGTKLHGWFLQKTSQTPVIIYFGGNSEEVSGMVYHFEKFGNYSLLLINYRGYGLSEGKPSEKNLFDDAEAIFDTIVQWQNINPKHIIAMGRSLGTGVAVHLANNRPIQGVILASPYDSITKIVQLNFPFVPTKLLLKHNFNSIGLAPTITSPMLALVATQDTIIPPSNSYNLVAKWNGINEIEWIEHANHDNIPDNEFYWNAIRRFLTKLTAKT